MQTRLQKWGDSLALRIPKILADKAGLDSGSPVILTLENGRIVITPAVAPPLTLDDLLARVTDENRPGEIDTGPAVGNEI